MLNLCDYLYENYHFRCSEEFAFSFIFKKHNEIFEAEDSVYHYCYIKEARYLLANLLNYFHLDDKVKFNEYLNIQKISPIFFDLINYDVREIPTLAMFLSNFISRSEDFTNNKPLHSIYFTENSIFFESQKNWKKFKKYIQCTRMYQSEIKKETLK